MIKMSVDECIRAYKDYSILHKRIGREFWAKLQLHVRNLSFDDFSKFVDVLAPSHLVSYRNFIKSEM